MRKIKIIMPILTAALIFSVAACGCSNTTTQTESAEETVAEGGTITADPVARAFSHIRESARFPDLKSTAQPSENGKEAIKEEGLGDLPSEAAAESVPETQTPAPVVGEGNTGGTKDQTPARQEAGAPAGAISSSEALDPGHGTARPNISETTAAVQPGANVPTQHTSHTWGAWQKNSDGSETRYCTVCGAHQTQKYTVTGSGGSGSNQPETGPDFSKQHQHVWVSQRRLVKESWYEPVVIQEAYDENVCVMDPWDEAVYETHWFCGACGIDFTANGMDSESQIGDHMSQHMLNGESSRYYTNRVQVGTVHHDAEYELVHHEALYDYVFHDAEYETYEVCAICGITR